MSIPMWFLTFLYDRVTATECEELYNLRVSDREPLPFQSKKVKKFPYACKLYNAVQVVQVVRMKHGKQNAAVTEASLQFACTALGIRATGDKAAMLTRLKLHIAALLKV